MAIKLKIETQQDLLKTVYELKKAGILTNVEIGITTFPEEAFPIEVPVDINGITKLLENPIIRPFKKKINQQFTLKVNDLARSM